MVKKALLIGINYNNTCGQLHGCINDVHNIKSLLVTQFGFTLNEIRILTDNDILPTRVNIESGIRWLLQNLKRGDVIYLHFSGHGYFISDLSKDETDGRDEVIVPLDYESAGFITDDWIFANLVLKVPAGVCLWAIIDCCHSGTILDLKYNYRSNPQYRSPVIPKNIEYKDSDWSNNLSSYIENSTGKIMGKVYLFSGCLDSQVANDALLNNQSQGAFSCCLIESLKSRQPKTLRRILKEVNARLKIKGFANQNSQLSLYDLRDLNRIFSL